MSFFQKLRAAWQRAKAEFKFWTTPDQALAEPDDTLSVPAVNMASVSHPPDVQAALDRIAVATADQLPSLITREHTDWQTGETETVHPDGRPLSVIDKAIMARQAELRRRAGGQ